MARGVTVGLAALAVAGVLTFGGYQAGFWSDQEQSEQDEAQSVSAGSHSLRDLLARSDGTLRGGAMPENVGGGFQLTNHLGETVTNQSFGDAFKLIYFGYTFCPDVCPTELADIRTALDLLGDKANQIQPLFITLDPARDTVEHLAGYVPLFHDRLVGLTGAEATISEIAAAFQVPYEIVVEEGNEEYYHIDHASFIFLMGPDDELLDIYVYNDTAQDIAAGLEIELDAYIN